MAPDEREDVIFEQRCYPWHWEGKSTLYQLLLQLILFMIGFSLIHFLWAGDLYIESIPLASLLGVLYASRIFVFSHYWHVKVSIVTQPISNVKLRHSQVTLERVPGVLNVFDQHHDYICAASFSGERAFAVEQSTRELLFRVGDMYYLLDDLSPGFRIEKVKESVELIAQAMIAADETPMKPSQGGSA